MERTTIIGWVGKYKLLYKNEEGILIMRTDDLKHPNNELQMTGDGVAM